MELREYWRVFKRRAWIPVVLAVVAVLTAGVLSYLSRPSFTATATALAKVGGTGVPTVIGFQQAASSNSVAVATIQQLGLNETVDHLINRVRVSSAAGNLHRISVTDPDAARAAAI